MKKSVVFLIALLFFGWPLIAQDNLIIRENKGQWDPRIVFKGSSARGANVSFLRQGLSFAFSRELKPQSADNTNPGSNTNTPHRKPSLSPNREALVFNISFDGANKDVEISADGKQESHTSYFTGTMTALNVPDYSQLRYNSIYPGIDLKYYAAKNGIEYDYILHPGASLSSIQMKCEGLKKISLNPKGELQLESAWGLMSESAPYSYQIINGQKKEVDIRFQIYTSTTHGNSTTYGFKINGRYDKEQDLIIDPVYLGWGTYMDGKTNTTFGYQYDIATDLQGNIYGTGFENAGYAVTAGAYSTTYAGGSSAFNGDSTHGCDVFVYKLKSDGTTLLWATYVGGNNIDMGRGLKVDASGNVYVAGITNSTDFPVSAAAFNKTYAKTTGQSSYGFIFKLNSTGSALMYSTYLGGTEGDEWLLDLALTASSEAIVTGWSSSPDYPTSTGAFQTALSAFGGSSNAIVSRINTTGSALVYSTFVGGEGNDMGLAMDIDANDNVFVVGNTQSNNFPVTAGCFQSAMKGSFENTAFVFSLAPNGSSLNYSTYLGGSIGEEIGFTQGASYWSYGFGIAVNSSDEAFVTGATESFDFPVTAGAYQTARKSNENAFVTCFNSTGTGLIYSTYLGGSRLDAGFDIKVNSKNEAYVAGTTLSQNFPYTTCAYDSALDGNYYDVFLTKLSANGKSLMYSTYFGGSNNDYSDPSIELISNGCNEDVAYGFTTHSLDVPTTPGSYKTAITTTLRDNDHPYVCKFQSKLKVNFTSTVPSCSTPVTFTASQAGLCGLFDTLTVFSWNFGDGTIDSGQVVNHLYKASGTYSVKFKAGCPFDSITKTIVIPLGLPVKTDSVPVLCASVNSGSASVTALGGTAPFTYSWSTGISGVTSSSSPFQITGLSPGSYTVTVEDASSCSVIDSIRLLTPPPFGLLVSANPFICPNDTAQLKASGALSYTWTPAAGLSNSLVSNPKAFPVTTTKYKVTGTAGTCIGSDSVLVTVYPAAKGTVSKDTVIVSGASLTISASGGSSYYWTPAASLSSANSPDPTATPSVTTTYRVLITDSNGCRAIDTVTVTIENDLCSGNAVYIPSAFSPNGDGENDLLYVRGICIKDLTFIIYDRWGEKVFETTSVNTAWDGTFRGQKLNEAVFAYTISATLYSGTQINKKGNVTLLR